MGQRPPVRGFFNGTANTLYLCLGGIPSRIEMCNLTGATPDWLMWDRTMIHNVLTCEGMVQDNVGETFNMAEGEGVTPYFGGDLMDSLNQTTVEYGDGIYIMNDDHNYRVMSDATLGKFGDASDADITKWKLDTVGSETGHFNDGIAGGDVNGTYIGAGSKIIIKAPSTYPLSSTEGLPKGVYETCIFSVTANTGEAADEVKLMHNVPSGDVLFIGGKYGYKPVPRGQTTSPGIKINDVTYINVSDEFCGFVAWFD